MPQYKLLHGKMHPPRKGEGAGGPIIRKGDIVTMSEARAEVYSDMLEVVMPNRAPPPAPKPAPKPALKPASKPGD